MRALLLTSIALLSACHAPSGEEEASQASPTARQARPVSTAPVPAQAPAAPVTAAAPEPVRIGESQQARPAAEEKTAQGAVRRLQQYCDAVATRRYGDAYRLWSDDGRASGLTEQQFADSFAKYAAYDCHIGPPGRTDGAAGSIYVDIPVMVTGALTRGGGFRLEGPVTLRRVNDVDGSTAEQRRWHLASSGLKPRP
jgi:hypothetical protein